MLGITAQIVFNMKEILLMVIPSTLAYLYGYKRNKVKLEHDRLSNLEKSIEIYQTIVNDMGKKIESLSKEINKLELKIQDLIKENKQLKQKNSYE